MTDPKHTTKRLFTAPIALALSLSLSSAALAAPGDTNSTNNGRDISGGTYYNTGDNKTTFINNRGSDGLNLPAGQTVRGLEVNGAGLPTGNGGTLHFYAPGSMVRLDGNVDVSGIVNGSGAYTGNGGRVFVDSAFLFQNGTIFANGFNGGSVQFNVGSAMFGPASRVEARGFGGLAGTISVNGVGTVDLQNGAIFDASGRGINTQRLSDNVNVNIVASLVNNNGIIRANAVNVGQDGHIALLNNNATLAAAEAGELARSVGSVPSVPVESNLDGGVVRLVSTGQTRTDCVNCAADKAQVEGIVTQAEADTIKTRNDALIASSEGNVVNTGTVQANGGDNTNTTPELGLDGGAGGKIIVSAANDVNNTGLVEAKGGRGADYFSLDNVTQAPGDGGAGGTIAISAQNSINNATGATLDASGGNGGNSVDGEGNGFNLTANSIEAADQPRPDVLPTPPNAVTLSANAETDVEGGIRAGSGGNGGVVALSYGNSALNDGNISANGGVGGNGLSVSVDGLSVAGPEQVAITTALATGGAGGFGGQGGLVVLSGPGNPTGTGLISVNGGAGGLGGNATARAGAMSMAANFRFQLLEAQEQALATAVANGGQGGQGGEAGLVLTPDPVTATFTYSARSGAQGEAGLADAQARSYAIDSSFAEAIATGRTGSSARSLAGSVSIPYFEEATSYAEGTFGGRILSAFQNRSIYGLTKPQFIALANGTSFADASESVHLTNPTQISSDGIIPVTDGLRPGPGNLPELDFAGTDATTTVITGTPQGANQPLAQTQNNQVVVNGNTALLLSKNGNTETTVTDRINDAFSTDSVTFLNNQGESPIRHLLVSDVSNTSLVLNKPEDGSFDGLTSLTVNGLNETTIPSGTIWTVGSDPFSGDVSTGGGHASVTSTGDVATLGSGGIAAYGINTGGSIGLTGENVLLINGTNGSTFTTLSTNTDGSAFHGGAITLKANSSVQNDPGINEDSDNEVTSNGSVLGGTIRLQAGTGLANNGVITANGGLQGGSIIGKAGLVALNQQLISANGGENGGYVRWHGNALSVNGPDIPGSLNQVGYLGAINAQGGINGGVVKLTAGGPVPDGFILDAATVGLANLPSGQAGFGITQGTLLASNPVNGSLVTALPDTLPLGSAINAGSINTQGTEGDVGVADVAGNGLAYATDTSSFNGVTTGTSPAVFFANANTAGTRLIAGPGAVLAAVCDQPLPENPTLESTPPGTPSLPGADQGASPLLATFGLRGELFQNQRPYLQDRLPVPTNNKLILRLGTPGIFLAKAYAPITQRILDLALEEYNRELANGKTIDEALRITQLYLEQAGVDSEIAAQLNEQIAAGSYQADKRVVVALKSIASDNSEQKQVSPSEGNDPTVRQ
jgi:hypothetical protein